LYLRQVDDQALIRAVRAGDASAFERLVGPLIDPAYRLAATMLRDRDEADDAVQEATLKAWRAVRRLRPDTATVRPWFLTIVANQCRSVRRARWWTVLKLPDLAGLPDTRSEGALAGGIDLERALATLDRDSRAALLLRFYEDLPLAEVARILGISESAAKSRVQRAVKRLRLDLELTEVYA
jgi:RNA polymerase sigma-70 factor (ECF subfamily)